MVDSQLKPNGVLDDRLIGAMSQIPRESFVPEAINSLAYVDEDLQIGDERYLMEAMIFGKLIQACAITDEDVVLDIGCGLGYATAVMGKLAATVVALEEDQQFYLAATKNLANLNVDNAAVIEGPHNLGAPSHGPYDVIFIGGAVENIPDEIKHQLNNGGRLATVIRSGKIGRGLIIKREGEEFAHRELFDALTPILTGFKEEQGFVFN